MLSSKQRKFLRSKAHHLKPVVIIGKADIGDYVIKTVDECLKSHELVKVKFNGHKESKHEVIDSINGQTDSECIGIIGNVAIIFRQNIEVEDQIYKLD
tara:strand:- start:541 stop:834 length:294 start_codon:yes stop_codon:yes gene_type:complete